MPETQEKSAPKNLEKVCIRVPWDILGRNGLLIYS